MREIAATKATKRLVDSYAGMNVYAGPQDYFVYRLWDADKNRACACDEGYAGIDCSQYECPRGDDPLTTSPATCGGAPCADEVQAFMIGGNQAGGLAGHPVNYALTFVDYNGFAFTTANVGIDTYLNYGAPANAAAKASTEASIKAALEALPNNATGIVSVSVTGDGTNGAFVGDANIRVLVTFTTLSGNVPDMIVVPGTPTLTAAAGTPPVAQPSRRIQTIVVSTSIVSGWTISATIFPRNLVAIRKDSTLGTDDTTSSAAVAVLASSAAGVRNAIVSAIQAAPAVAYYGAAAVSAAAYGDGAGHYVITLVMPDDNLGDNPIQLTVKNGGGTDVTSTNVVSIAPISVDGNTEHSTCSNRGVCDGTTGLCTCFTGYHGEACDSQSALAM